MVQADLTRPAPTALSFSDSTHCSRECDPTSKSSSAIYNRRPTQYTRNSGAVHVWTCCGGSGVEGGGGLDNDRASTGPREEYRHAWLAMSVTGV